MSLFEPPQSPWVGRMLSVLRIVVALLFIEHGAQKLFGFPPGPRPGMFPVALATKFGLAGVLETFGGAAILIGLFTRPIAFLLSGEMAYAYFSSHFPRSFFPILNGGEPAVLFCFIYFYFAFAGAGPWSVDAMISRSRRDGGGTP